MSGGTIWLKVNRPSARPNGWPPKIPSSCYTPGKILVNYMKNYFLNIFCTCFEYSLLNSIQCGHKTTNAARYGLQYVICIQIAQRRKT